MGKKKKNCWEYMHCGREPGGENVAEKGVCPAAADASYEGVNSGSCGGRFCWAVAGTMCGSKIQGTFAEKRKSCTDCNFYKQVKVEEGSLNVRTKFLRFVQPYSESSLLHDLLFMTIRQGERFILQGEILDTAYIIQQGSCIELVEKNKHLHPVGHRGEGDIVGMISLFTREPTGFHVEAETDMDVWAISRENFENIPEQDPDLFSFLTELVADRFDRRGPHAERSIGKYLITDILGTGGYSIVYKGFHAELDIPVAIKMMRHHLAMQPEFLERFQNEAKIIAGLNHENIVKVFDVEKRYKTIFIIYEFLKGESLNDLIGRLKSISPELCVRYLQQIASAMAYAGNMGLVHRDINALNVIVLPDDQIKLIDFGLACPAGTDDFEMGGNVNYLAPELFDGEPADFRSDIFSLGVTAFLMVTGQLPFTADDSAKQMEMIKSAPIPDPLKMVPDLPEKLCRFILKACEKNPEKRFQTPEQAVQFLDSIEIPENYSTASLKKKNTRTVTFTIPFGKDTDFSTLLNDFKKDVLELGGSIVTGKGE